MYAEVRFVNRVSEINALKDFSLKFRAVPLYIFGPEGCGKTRLLKEFVKSFSNFFGDNAIAIYIDALERESIGKALVTSPTIRISLDLVASIVEKFSGLGVGEVLINSISTLLEKVVGGRRLEDRYVLVAVDDVVRAIGLNKIEWYVKWLYELLWKLREEYRPKSINFIITTSEGISLDLVSRHRHATISILWNLDKEAFRELFYELKPPRDIDFEDVWRLFGGNPGKLIEFAKRFDWNSQFMIKNYSNVVEKFVREIIRRSYVDELELVIEDIDNLGKITTPKMMNLEKMLIERNLVIYKKWTTLTLDYPPTHREIGVGEIYAWQVPLYKYIAEEKLKELKHLK